MTFLAGTVAVNTSPGVVVPAADFDRAVLLSPDADNVFVGFGSTSGFRVPQGVYLGSSTVGRTTEFVLPADEDLYAWTSSGSANLAVLATNR